MKKILLLSGLLAFSTLGYTQITVANNNNVGIGTTKDYVPSSTLEIRGTKTIGGKFDETKSFLTIKEGVNKLLLDPNEIYGSSTLYIGTKNTSNDIVRFRTVTDMAGEASEKMVIKSNGNVGIGTISPESKLHLLNGATGGSVHYFADLTLEDNDHGMVNILTPSSKTGYYGFSDENDNYVGGIQYEHSLDRMVFRVNNMENNVLIASNGYVGIGTNNPKAKLDVNGSIFVRGNQVHADYVFQKYYEGESSIKVNYTMPTLEEVEAFTKKYKHLPEVPSYQEIQGQGGVDIGQITNILLQKIEELTLYTIEQQKELKKHQELLEKQQLLLQEQAEALEKLEKN